MSDTSESSFSGTSTPDMESVGLSDPRLLQSGRHMLDLVNRLHNTGVNVDIDLPLIAVIGQQSAGKSSLIESISGITLPRAAGTCTRCPTECRLSHSSNEWNCKVSLRTIKDGKTSVKQFGSIITSKADVEDRIRRAQWAILSPTVLSAHGAEYFLNGDKHGEDAELTFSANLVSLEISGPDVADLSFCDLPGLIAGVGQAGNTGDIDLVKALVTSYIQRPSCIILLTVACETDFQNQGAQELAKAHDPFGKRTIGTLLEQPHSRQSTNVTCLGVLTKPDRIPLGEEDSWFSLIRNEKEPLDNGWYCVKQPSSAQINKGITWAEARQREAEFFEGTVAWQGLDSIYKRYLRTENLVERLSSILSGLISRRLPEIQREIDKTIIATQDALSTLPKPPSSDPRNEIGTLLYNFVRGLSIHMQGVPDEGIIQAIRPAQEQFRRAIRTTSPEFQPFYKHQGKRLGKAKFLEGEEGHDEYLNDDDGNKEPTHTEGHSRPTGREIYIDEVIDRADKARTRELPGTYPYIVQESYIKSFVKQWHTPAKILCQSVGRMLETYVQGLVHKYFQSFGQGLLEQRVRMLIQIHLRKCEERTAEHVEWLFALENGPFTLNTHYLANYREKFLGLYRAEREKDRNPTLTAAINGYKPGEGSAPLGKVLSGLSEIGVHGVKPQDLASIIEKDGTEPALAIMANVRAYFQVGYKRFSDNVPLAIDYELIRGIERDILQTLNVGLEINGPNGHQICKSFAQESSTTEARRKELGGKLERMYAASEQLSRIGQSA